MIKYVPLLLVFGLSACGGSGRFENELLNAANLEVTTNEDVAKTDDLSSHQVETDIVSYRLVSSPSNGTLSVDDDGVFTYNPAENFNGLDRFEYEVTDSSGVTNTGTVIITVTSVNDLPVASEQSIETDEDTDGSGQTSATDVDHGVSELRYRLLQPATNGAVTISELGEISYTPNTNYNGDDSFIYEVVDPENGTDTATVALTIHPVADLPNGANDELEILVSEDTLFSGQLTVTDVDGGTITYQLSDADSEKSEFGSSSVNSESGDYSYQPSLNYNGGNGDGRDYQDDSFKVVVFDDAIETGRITVNIEVTPVDDPPIAEEGFYSTAVDVPLNGDLVASDVDDDTLIFSVVDDSSMEGSLTLNADGSFDYIPPDGEVVEDSFTFEVSDGQQTTAPSKAQISVVLALGESKDVDLTSLAGPSPLLVGTPPPPGPPVIIHFTVHEPSDFRPNLKYPLVLEGHGYGGRRTNAIERGNDGFKGLLNAGYGVISITQRGFGRTEGHLDSGNIRLFDPNYEGRDLMQVIDWAEENLDWVLYKDSNGAVVDKSHPDANIVLGAIGGSYGGGYQHTIVAIDPKKRIDAIAAEITWYDLRFSLFSGNAFKSYWAGLLSAAGNGTGSQDPEVNQGLVQGLAANMLDEDKLKLLYDNSFISHCENNSTYTHNVTAAGGKGPNIKMNLEPVDALYWQSPADSLFNMNEMERNTACMRARGADVRALTKVNGHDGGAGSNCGPFTVNETILDWFDEKLKGEAGKADSIPANCFNLTVSAETTNDHIITDTFPVGGAEFQIDDNGQEAGGEAVGVTANGSSPQKEDVLLFTTTEETIIAGIPTATITLGGQFAPPPELENDLGLLPADPIVFIGITVGDTLQMPNQVKPLRQYGTHEIELVGLNVKIPAGTEVKLTIYSGFSGRYPSSGSLLPIPVTIKGSVQIPLHAVK
jgi:VCBS repeat-containing protein